MHFCPIHKKKLILASTTARSLNVQDLDNLSNDVRVVFLIDVHECVVFFTR